MATTYEPIVLSPIRYANSLPGGPRLRWLVIDGKSVLQIAESYWTDTNEVIWRDVPTVTDPLKAEYVYA